MVEDWGVNRALRNLNDITSQNYERAMSVMTSSCFYAIKHGSRAMVVTSEEKPQPSGNIILTSSCAAFLGAYADIAYSKHILTLQIYFVQLLTLLNSRVQECSQWIGTKWLCPVVF